MNKYIVLSSKELITHINVNLIKSGIEITHIEIEKGIKFKGKVNNKINCKFSGSIFIKQINNNILLLESKNLEVNGLGFLKLSNKFLLKTVANIIGDDYLSINENNIAIHLDKLSVIIEEIYIKSNLLYILGENIDIYLNA